MTTTRNRSGTKTTEGYLGSRRFLSSLFLQLALFCRSQSHFGNESDIFYVPAHENDEKADTRNSKRQVMN